MPFIINLAPASGPWYLHSFTVTDGQTRVDGCGGCRDQARRFYSFDAARAVSSELRGWPDSRVEEVTATGGPTAESIDAAIKYDRMAIERTGYSVGSARSLPATDANGPRIRIRIYRGSWEASVTLEEIDPGEWYADAQMPPMAGQALTKDDLDEQIVQLHALQTLLRSVRRAAGLTK